MAAGLGSGTGAGRKQSFRKVSENQFKTLGGSLVYRKWVNGRVQGSTADRYFLVGVSQIGLLQGNHGDHIWFTKSEELPGNRNKTGKSAVLSGISPGHGANHQNV